MIEQIIFLKNKERLPGIALLKQYQAPFNDILLFLVEENELIMLQGLNYGQVLGEDKLNEMIHMIHANLSIPA